MLGTPTFASDVSTSVVVVDLIGDLDETLGTLVAETVARIARHGTSAIFVTTKHVALTSPDGLVALDAGLAAAREAGVSIALEAGSRKMRAAFATAGIATDEGRLRPASVRHLMIARHAAAPRKRRTELPLSA